MQHDELVLGIDGGGSKTTAWLARRLETWPDCVVGRGTSGASNLQAVSLNQAMTNLEQAIAGAFQEASLDSGSVAAAVLAIAGSDRPATSRHYADWARRRGLAQRVRIVHDALPVLAAGTSDQWGIALISGTGSICYGLSADGRSARAGGWGYLFGDEGSGYCLGVAGLRAAAQMADGRAVETELLSVLVDHFHLREAAELVAAVYPIASDRAVIADLARVVIEVARHGDPVAKQIVEQAASDLAAAIGAVVDRLSLPRRGFPLALAGSLLLGANELREAVLAQVAAIDLKPASVALVPEPVIGAVKLAFRECDHADL